MKWHKYRTFKEKNKIIKKNSLALAIRILISYLNLKIFLHIFYNLLNKYKLKFDI